MVLVAHAVVLLIACDPVRVAFFDLGIRPGGGVACNETRPPLSDAIGRKDLRTAKSILESGIDPNTPYRFCSRPTYHLRHAIGTGNVEMVELLLAKGAHPNVMLDPRTPLLISVVRDLYYIDKDTRLKILSLLVAYGVDVNAKENLESPYIGREALTELIYDGKVDEAVFLIRSGARYRVPRPSGDFALLTAAISHARTYSGLWEVAEEIVRAGEDVTRAMAPSFPYLREGATKDHQARWMQFYLRHGGDPCIKEFATMLSHGICERCAELIPSTKQCNG